MRPLHRLATLLAAAVLAGPLLPGAGAAFVPSCLSGVRVPQLCTLAATIAGSAVAPGATSQTTALVPTAAPRRTHGDCAAGVASYLEQYEGAVQGTVRGVATNGILLLELRGCSDGKLYVVGAIDTVGDRATSGSTVRRLRHDVVVKLDVAAGSSTTAMRYVWDTSVSDCTRGTNTCRPVSAERSVSASPAKTSSVAIRDSGMATRFETEAEYVTYDAAGTATSRRAPASYEIGASVSGHWARVNQTVVSEAGTRTFQATSKPYNRLWQVGIGP